MIIKLFRVILLIQLMLPLTSHAQSEAMLNGLNWLKANQAPDGSWSSAQSSSTGYYTTISALDSLATIGEAASTAYTNGLSWTTNAFVEGTTYVAPRVKAVAVSGGDTTTDLNTLLSYHDVGYGWGGDKGHSTSIFHTALSLQAIKAVGYSDPAVISSSLAYLSQNQNSDGGWGFCQGGESNVYMTAVVSAALQQFPQVTSIATAVNKASNYLLSHQNSDGGFGSSESTPYETALAFSALVAVSGNTTALTSASNYLVATQSANGSWNDDPYSTALALKALYYAENKPSAPPPPAGGAITGTVVDAVTKARVPGVAISLPNNLLINTTSDSVGRFTLSDVPPGAQGVSFSLTGYAAKAASATVSENTVTDLGDVHLLSAYSTGTISGKITDANGAPLSDVAVTITGAWSGTAMTGADGGYSLTYVAPGAVILTAAKSGYLTVTASGSVAARTTLSFSPRMNTTASQVTTGTLVGRVVDSQWGLPIGHLPEEAGVTVTLSGGISVAVEPTGRGYFTIPGLVPNTYQVTIGMNGFSIKTFRVIISAGVTTDLGTVGLDWSLSEMALVGKVTDARTGTPIANARVDISDTPYSGITDFAGSYAVAGIPCPSELTIRFHADNYIGQSGVVTASPGMQTINVALEPEVTKGNITGIVIDASSGSPLAGATLTIAGASTVSASTGADGRFTITDAPQGVQKVDVSLTGYASRTLTTAIGAGTTNNVGEIPLGHLPLPASVRGTVWDAAANTPFAGVRMEVTGSDTLQGATDSAGEYAFAEVAPGNISVAAIPGKSGYFGGRLSGELAPGGLMVFSPTLTNVVPSAATLTVRTDKAGYLAADRVGITVDAINRVSAAAATSLVVRVTAPSGATVYRSAVSLELPADGTAVKYFECALTSLLQGGGYSVRAELFAENGAMLAAGSAAFDVSVSQITVTPQLPDFFSAGDNQVSFNLVNSGSIGVSSGVFEVRLTDPEGVTVFAGSQTFTLDAAQSKAFTYRVSVPPLKFGTYTLSYTQRDETIGGRGKDFAMPNSVAIVARYDDSSHRVRQEATLTATLTNTGRFILESGGLVTVAIPDAQYAEAKSLAPPIPGDAAGRTLLYRFVIPETLTAGAHATRVTYSLQSGSTSLQTSQLMIPESSVTVSAPTAVVNAGSDITAVFTNSGGVDTDVQYALTLYDSASRSVAVRTATGTVPAGGSFNAPVTVPAAAVSGSYNLKVIFTDLKIQATKMEQFPLTVNGVSATIASVTDKAFYLLTESITALNSIANAGAALQGGNLHLEVSTAGGSLQEKTWTSQYDFQQGVRKGVDTFETPNDVTLLTFSDNFNDGVLNSDRWGISSSPGYAPSEQGGALRMLSPPNPTNTDKGTFANCNAQVSGDFDVTLDFSMLTNWVSPENDTIDLGVWSSTYWMRVLLQRAPWLSGPNIGSAGSNGSYKWVPNPSNQTGKLRLTRVGSTYSAYYWGGSSWIKLISETGPGDVATSLSVGVWNEYSPVTAEALVDNFTVSTHTYPASGTLTFKYDAGRSDTWRKLNYSADTPAGTSIKFRTRTAETESGLATATWSSYITASGTGISSPKGRWIQVETNLATTNPRVTPILHDITITHGEEPGTVLWQTDIATDVAAHASAEVNKAVGTLGMTGKLYLKGTLTSTSGQTVAASEYPFYVVSGNLLFALETGKKTYKPGETVMISGSVRNLAGTDASNLMLTVTGKPAGGAEQTLGSDTFTLPAGASRPVSFTATAGAEGMVELKGSVVQNGNTLVTSATRYEVTAPIVTASLTGPETAGDVPFALTLVLANSGKSDAAIVVGTSFGAPSQGVTVPAGQSVLLQYQQQIDADTTFTFVLTGDVVQTLKKFVSHVSPVLDGSAAATIAADKVAYNPNEQARLSVTMTAASMKEALSAVVMVSDAKGEAVYRSSTPVRTMNPGQVVAFSKYWSVGTAAPGTYLATLQLSDSSGVVIAAATCNVSINAPTSPKALLKGSLVVARNSILSGETLAVSYGVTNVGNIDLPDVNLTIQTVDVASATIYDTKSEQTGLLMGATHTRSASVDTSNYGAKDYLVLLRATIDGVEETVGSGYFRVNGAPSAPALAAPSVGGDVETSVPQLVVSNAADPNDDRLTYRFEVYSDSALTTLAAAGDVSETTGMTAWTPPAALVENQTYYWRCRAFDGSLYGAWMQAASFRVNASNDPPTAPKTSTPAHGTAVMQYDPTLTVDNSADPDSAGLTYNFQIALDSDFTEMVASVTGVAGGATTTSWQVPTYLEENRTYYWRAQADDWLIEGPWSSTAAFLVNTANDAPSAPVILSPTDKATITTRTADVVAKNGVDPDSATVSYYFEADTSPSFDSPHLVRSGKVSEGEGATTWYLERLLDNTLYFVRAKASDGTAESPWSAISGFFVNTANDAPTAPVLANPSEGAGVSVFNPILSVHPSNDLDRDALFYQFEVYADASMTELVVRADGVMEAGELVSWQVFDPLTENRTYYWRARAFDGVAYGEWMKNASFMVNTANDAPGAPTPLSPGDGDSVTTTSPVLSLLNATDPDSSELTYQFEVYADGIPVAVGTGVKSGNVGITNWQPETALADNAIYQWRSRAFDGASYGPWTAFARFTVHLPTCSISATLDFDPDTLNTKSNGTWVVVYIELPPGYRASDIDISSVRLEGAVPAEARPYSIGDHDKDGRGDLMVKFKRSDVISVLSAGDKVPVHVSGKVGEVTFEGVDVIRVIK